MIKIGSILFDGSILIDLLLELNNPLFIMQYKKSFVNIYLSISLVLTTRPILQ